MEKSLVVVPLESLLNIISESIAQEFEKQTQPLNEFEEEDKDVLLTRKETSKLLGVCVATLDNWTREGKLKKYRNGNSVRYSKKEVLASFSSLQKYMR